MDQHSIAIIGGGHMGGAVLLGLIADGYKPGLLWLADPNSERLSQFENTSIFTTLHNEDAVKNAQTIVLAIKPQNMRKVALEIAPLLKNEQLIISIAAGIQIKDLRRWLDSSVTIIRAMPNTPAMVGSGATAMYGLNLKKQDKNRAESIMRAVGMVVWLENEELMDTVTALSGSGPAYFFLVMEIMEKIGIEQGLDANTARLLTLQTAFGAAKIALESPDDVTTLRARVTSPGGTTEQAMKIFQERQLEDIYRAALKAAQQRARELATLLGNEL